MRYLLFGWFVSRGDSPKEDDKAFDGRVFRSIGMRLVGTSRTFQVNR
jgi:hypothetical protein